MFCFVGFLDSRYVHDLFDIGHSVLAAAPPSRILFAGMHGIVEVSTSSPSPACVVCVCVCVPIPFLLNL